MSPMLSTFVIFLHGVDEEDLKQNLTRKRSKPFIGVGRASPLSHVHVKPSKLECAHRGMNAEQMASHHYAQ